MSLSARAVLLDFCPPREYPVTGQPWMHAVGTHSVEWAISTPQRPLASPRAQQLQVPSREEETWMCHGRLLRELNGEASSLNNRQTRRAGAAFNQQTFSKVFFRASTQVVTGTETEYCYCFFFRRNASVYCDFNPVIGTSCRGASRGGGGSVMPRPAVWLACLAECDIGADRRTGRRGTGRDPRLAHQDGRLAGLHRTPRHMHHAEQGGNGTGKLVACTPSPNRSLWSARRSTTGGQLDPRQPLPHYNSA